MSLTASVARWACFATSLLMSTATVRAQSRNAQAAERQRMVTEYIAAEGSPTHASWNR